MGKKSKKIYILDQPEIMFFLFHSVLRKPVVGLQKLNV